MASSFELHIPKANEQPSHVDSATWDAYSQPAHVIKVAAKGSSPAGNASSNSASDATSKSTSASTSDSRATATSNTTVKDTVSVTDNIKQTGVGGVIGGGLIGLAAGSLIGRSEGQGRGSRGGGSACKGFEVGVHTIFGGGDLSTPNTACVTHPEDLDFSLKAAAQAVSTMDHAAETAQRAIEKGPTGAGQVLLGTANFDAEVSKHLADASLTATKRALDVPNHETLTATPLWSAALLNQNTPR
jgi:hypothetical protein